MQSVACSHTVGYRVALDPQCLPSTSSEVFQQHVERFVKTTGRSKCHGSQFCDNNGGWIAAARPLNGRPALRLVLPTGHGRDPKKKHILRLNVSSSLLSNPSGRSILSSEQRILYDVVAKQASIFNEQQKLRSRLIDPEMIRISTNELLAESYTRCEEVCAEYAKTFYLGTKLMTPERQRAIWAIYVWCRRTDELVDGPNASRITPTALDRWEERLEDIFRGQPYDMLDAALADTIARFNVDIQPFRDMVDGMRMDLNKSRYNNFDELYLYCYNVAGTVGLMSVPVMGIASDSKAKVEKVYNAALALGIANQLTNILRDVGEDARRHRVYLPQDELHQFGLSDEDVFAGVVTNKWRAFMKEQIRRARMFFQEAEEGVGELDKDSRWPVWASLILYQQILDSIEANDYDNFSKRAYCGKMKKFVLLPTAFGKAIVPPPSSIPLLSKA